MGCGGVWMRNAESPHIAYASLNATIL